MISLPGDLERNIAVNRIAAQENAPTGRVCQSTVRDADIVPVKDAKAWQRVRVTVDDGIDQGERIAVARINADACIIGALRLADEGRVE